MTAEETHVAASEMKTASRTLLRTIDGILDFARPGPKVERSVRLPGVFRRAASLLGPLVRGGNHSLEGSSADGAEWVRGNPMTIEQVLVNLVVNSLESSPSSVHVRIRTRPSVASDADPVVHILVRDDGLGIPEGLRERIFEPFFTTKANGTGLGLTTSYEAVREMGGDLRLHDVQRGTCFFDRTSGLVEHRRRGLRVMSHVLAVDDDRASRSALVRDVASHGYAVSVSDSIDDATRLFSTPRVEVLVLTDLRMTDRDGIDILVACRDLSRGPRAVLPSGHATPRDCDTTVELRENTRGRRSRPRARDREVDQRRTGRARLESTRSDRRDPHFIIPRGE